MNEKVRQPKKHNKTFYDTEITIQKTILKLLKKHRGRITARQVAVASGLSRQVIYKHHPNINQAIINNENDLMDKLLSELDAQLEKLSHIVSDHNGRIFYAVLIFMARHREIFCPICSDLNNQELLYRIIDTLYPKLDILWLPKGISTPKRDSLRVVMYINSCVSIIREWGKNTNCDIKKSSKYIESLLRTTANAAQNRLI